MATVRTLNLFPTDLEIVELSSFSAYDQSVYFENNKHTKAQLIEFLWRVQTWKASYGEFFYLSYPKPENEKALVCKGNRPFYYAYPAQPDIFLNFILGLSIIKDSENDLYAPYFYWLGGAGYTEPFNVQKAADLTYIVTGVVIDGVADVIITPDTYWPYDPGDGGGPIYDTATGKQLRSFPS